VVLNQEAGLSADERMGIDAPPAFPAAKWPASAGLRRTAGDGGAELPEAGAEAGPPDADGLLAQETRA
jgi:hypothetical protein